METPHLNPTVTGPDEQGAYIIQTGEKEIRMRPSEENKKKLVHKQHGFHSFKDARAAIELVVSNLQLEALSIDRCVVNIGLGAKIYLTIKQQYYSDDNLHISIEFEPSPGSKGIPTLVLRKLIEIEVLLASLVSE